MVESCFWAQEARTYWWDHIKMQVWKYKHWLQNFPMQKTMFLDLFEELDPSPPPHGHQNESCFDNSEVSGNSGVEACNTIRIATSRGEIILELENLQRDYCHASV